MEYAWTNLCIVIALTIAMVIPKTVLLSSFKFHVLHKCRVFATCTLKSIFNVRCIYLTQRVLGTESYVEIQVFALWHSYDGISFLCSISEYSAYQRCLEQSHSICSCLIVTAD